jgi:hypothetical protein
MTQMFEAVRTKFSTLDFVGALIEAWRKEFGTTPTIGQVRLVFSKFSHETAGGNSCWNFNIGNIKWKLNSDNGMAEGATALTGVWEIVNGKKVILEKTDPGSWFRSYKTLSNGIIDYLKLLNSQRYSYAFQALKEENLMEYVQRLHDKGYFTDTVENYAAGLKRWYNKFDTSTYQQALDLKKEEIPEIVELPEVEVIGEEKDYNQTVDKTEDNTFQKKEQSVEKLNFFQQILNFLLSLLNMFKGK